MELKSLYLVMLVLMCLTSIILSVREYNITYSRVWVTGRMFEEGKGGKYIIWRPYFIVISSMLFSFIHLIAFYTLLARNDHELSNRYKEYAIIPCAIISGVITVFLVPALWVMAGGTTLHLLAFWLAALGVGGLLGAFIVFPFVLEMFEDAETPDKMRRTMIGWYLVIYMLMIVIAWPLVIRPPELSAGFSYWTSEDGWTRYDVKEVHISSSYMLTAMLCLLQPIFAALLTLATTIPVKYWERRKAERLLRPVRPLRSPREILLELVRREIRISLDSLVSKTGLNKRKVERLLREMLDGGQLTGVLDRRAGTFTYVPDHKIEAIRRFIRSRGIVSIRELARKYSLTEREIELLVRKYARGGKTFK